MKKFRKALRGYNVKEVNAFINEVISQVEKMVAEDNRKTQIIKSLNEKVKDYQRREDTLNKSIMMAQETAEQMNRMARAERDQIINDAKKNANKIINEALTKAGKIEAESLVLKKNVQIFKNRLKNIVEQQLQIVEDIDNISL